METGSTACCRDCPDACTLQAHVENGRLVALKGSPADPTTRGFVCPRTARFPQRQHSPQRLLNPLLRSPRGELEPVPWETALEVAAERLLEIRQRYGSEAVLHYRSGGAMGYLKSLTSVFFEQFGPTAVKRGDICSGAGEWAQEQDFGISDSSDPEDLLNARLIVIWGKNVHTSSVHLLPILLEAKRRGAVLVGLDPVPTKAASLCHLFLTPRPGTDAQVALALVSYLEQRGRLDPEAPAYCANLEPFLRMAHAVSVEERFRRADISPTDGFRLAELYDELRPSSILVGWGAPRRSNGAATVRCLDALAAVSGNIGRPGACVSFYHGRRRSFSRRYLPPEPEPPRTFSEARLGAELEAADPPVRAIWITAGNPVAMLPDGRRVARELERADFTVVVETHHTDTTRCADLVLPTLTMVEDDDVMGAYGNHFLRASKPVMEPPGQARHELWIHRELARRVGLEGLLDGTPQEWKERLLVPEVDRALFRGVAVRQPGAPHVVFSGRRFPTADGKVDLITSEPSHPGSSVRPTPSTHPVSTDTASTDETFPFRLMALSHPDSQCSQWSVEPPSVPLARISERADPRWRSGQRVRLESRKGGLEVLLQRERGLHPELVVLPKGGSRLFGGWCPNDLIEAHETDSGGGACFYEEPVRMVALTEPSAGPEAD